MKSFIKGVALIQVLIISMIMSILGVFILQTVKEQVKISGLVDRKFNLRLQIENAESKLLQALVSSPRVRIEGHSEKFVREWNFYNEPFQLTDNVVAKVQDERGLVNLNIVDNRLFNSVLNELNIEVQDRRVIVSSLKDWKDNDDTPRANGAEADFYSNIMTDGPRNKQLQLLGEFSLIRGGVLIDTEDLEKYFTIANQSGFNITTAPELVIQAYLKDKTQVDSLLTARKSINIDESSLFRLTGLESDEFITFAVGNNLRVQLEAKDGSMTLKKSFSLGLNVGSHLNPIVVSNVKWN